MTLTRGQLERLLNDETHLGAFVPGQTSQMPQNLGSYDDVSIAVRVEEFGQAYRLHASFFSQYWELMVGATLSVVDAGRNIELWPAPVREDDQIGHTCFAVARPLPTANLKLVFKFSNRNRRSQNR